jgi:hypothetical protein
MITYETALKLKNLGFPQTGNGLLMVSNEGAKFENIRFNPGEIISLDENNPIVYLPSLSELIEAFDSRYKRIPGLINDAQFVLRKTFVGGKKGYMAALDGDFESYELERKYVFYSTSPEEAVANLWLEINKK